MLKYLEKREITSLCERQRRLCREIAAPRIPTLHRERELSGLKSYDKVFASAWLDHCTFVLGTKDNRLLRWDISTNRRLEIELPARPWPHRRPNLVETCGIHSIAINPSKTLLATGGANPSDTAIFKLPSFEPASLLVGHADWMFAAAWLTDTAVVTGSRDKTLKLWSITDKSFANISPVVTRSDHSEKIRDLKYHEATEKLATLSHDATCKIWDPHLMEVVRSVNLPDKRELVCLAMDQTLVAVGSQSFIMFVDTRCGHVRKIKSADESWGVRSLSFKEGIVTCGGGKGRLSFLDLRKEKYIELKSPAVDKGASPVELISYSTGQGSLEYNEVYAQHFFGQSINHAVYTHAYDVTGTHLLAAGGPLPFGLRGCYVAVW